MDKYDAVPFRPNFAAPIYAGGLPEEAEVTKDCPPFFMVVTNDDRRPVETAEMYIALKKAGVSAELHIYESGGHGYGLRRTDQPMSRWRDRMEEWMGQLKLLAPASQATVDTSDAQAVGEYVWQAIVEEKYEQAQIYVTPNDRESFNKETLEKELAKLPPLPKTLSVVVEVDGDKAEALVENWEFESGLEMIKKDGRWWVEK